MPSTFKVLFFLSAVGAIALHAGTAVSLTTPGDEYSGGEYTLGFEFSPLSNITVTSLGVFDYNQGALLSEATVGIWSTSGDLLTSVTVPSGTCSALSGYFCFASITPFALTAGTDYIVGSYLDSTASSLNTDQGGSGTFDTTLTIIEDRFSSDSTFAYPGTTDSDFGGAWLGANFQFSASAVPEPGGLALVGGGLAGLLAWRLRRSVHP